jgi:hypothetical protein
MGTNPTDDVRVEYSPTRPNHPLRVEARLTLKVPDGGRFQHESLEDWAHLRRPTGDQWRYDLLAQLADRTESLRTSGTGEPED